MVVVLAARVGGLVARDAVDVDAVDELELGEEVERAVDAGQADRAPVARAQPVVDLLRAEAAVLAREQREDLLAGAAGAVAGARELGARVLLPGVGHGRIVPQVRTVLAAAANENDLQ